MGLLLLMLLVSSTAMAWDAGCAAEYTEEQCAQAEGDGAPGSTGGGQGCPYYMCGNANAAAQESWDWCSASDPPTWKNCPIEYCEYRACIGLNC